MDPKCKRNDQSPAPCPPRRQIWLKPISKCPKYCLAISSGVGSEVWTSVVYKIFTKNLRQEFLHSVFRVEQLNEISKHYFRPLEKIDHPFANILISLAAQTVSMGPANGQSNAVFTVHLGSKGILSRPRDKPSISPFRHLNKRQNSS